MFNNLSQRSTYDRQCLFYSFALLLSAFWFFFDSFLRGKSKFPSKSVRCEGVEFEFSILCDVCAIVRVCMSWFHLKTRFHVTLVLSICVLHGKRVVASGIGMFVFVWCVCFVLRLHVTHVVFYFVRRLCSSPCLHVMVSFGNEISCHARRPANGKIATDNVREMFSSLGQILQTLLQTLCKSKLTTNPQLKLMSEVRVHIRS